MIARVYTRPDGRTYRKLIKGTGQNPPRGGRRPWNAGRRKGNRGHCGGCGAVGHNIQTCEVSR